MAEILKDILPLHLHKIVDKEFEYTKLLAPENSAQDNCLQTEWRGHLVTPGFNLETSRFYHEEWQGIKKGDVVVVTFPKSGTNITSAIVRRILTTKHPDLRKLFKIMPLTMVALETGTTGKYQILDYLNLKKHYFATHVPVELFNIEKAREKGVKIIYVARNVKDQTISWFHYSKQLFFKKGQQYPDLPNLSWDEFVETYMQGKHPLQMKLGEWYPDHIEGWSRHFDDDNVLFMSFEEIIANLPSAVQKISNFMEEPLSSTEIQEIANYCSFNEMKKRQATASGSIAHFQKKMKLVRSGKVDGWKKYFTVAQSEEMDKIIEEKLSNNRVFSILKSHL